MYKFGTLLAYETGMDKFTNNAFSAAWRYAGILIILMTVLLFISPW